MYVELGVYSDLFCPIMPLFFGIFVLQFNTGLDLRLLIFYFLLVYSGYICRFYLSISFENQYGIGMPCTHSNTSWLLQYDWIFPKITHQYLERDVFVDLLYASCGEYLVCPLGGHYPSNFHRATSRHYNDYC